MAKTYDLLIIGAGQAGLAAGYYAELGRLDYIIVDSASSIGHSWRHRYDSLVLFTPRAYSSLPGLDMPGNDDEYPAKDDVANYLQQYTSFFDIKVQLESKVIQLTKEASEFTAKTNSTEYTARAVIIATGPFQSPYIPEWSEPTDNTLQIHSSGYRNLDQIQGNKVLVVGGGNSGVQIAKEAARKYDVTLSIDDNLRFIPTHLFGKSVFWWLDKFGILFAPKKSLRAKLLHNGPDPIVGTDIKTLLENGTIQKRPVAIGMKDGLVQFADNSKDRFDTIIWCTGYRTDYGFIDISHALNKAGAPRHNNGISTSVDGLGYLGLKRLRTTGSSLIGGVGYDAKEVIRSLFP